MAASEAARHDLYTGLVDLLGEERARTLMSFLPPYDPSEIVTTASLSTVRSDLAGVESRLIERFERVEDRIAGLERKMDTSLAQLRGEVDTGLGQLRRDTGTGLAQLRSDMDSRFLAMDKRMDRFFQTLVGGLFVIVAAMAGIMATIITLIR